MDTVTYPNDQVAEFVQQHFVPARVDVKDSPQLANDFMVHWSPTTVIADSQGKVHYRIDGFVPAHEFVAKLSLGVGRFHLNREEFEAATERFDEVSQKHQGTEAAAEAMYWRAVTDYKQSKDVSQLMAGWQKLREHYPESEWSRKADIPKEECTAC